MPLNQTHMSKLTLICDNQAQLEFDPVGTADNPESVAFDISFTWNVPFQSCRFAVRECWFDAKALRDFESHLDDLLQSQNGSVSLPNMDDRPVLSISKDGNAAQIVMCAADTSGMGDFRFTINTHASRLEDLYNRLRDYPKWW